MQCNHKGYTIQTSLRNLGYDIKSNDIFLHGFQDFFQFNQMHVKCNSIVCFTYQACGDIMYYHLLARFANLIKSVSFQLTLLLATPFWFGSTFCYYSHEIVLIWHFVHDFVDL